MNGIEPLGPYALCLAEAERSMIKSTLEEYEDDPETVAAVLRVSEEFLRARAGVLGIELRWAPPVQIAAAQAAPIPDDHKAEHAKVVAIRRPIVTPIPRGPNPTPVAKALPELTIEQREELAAELLDDDDDDEED